MATLKIYQLDGGYGYNTDSLILAHFAKDFVKKSMRVLDVGAGSGVLGVLLAREKQECGGIELDLIELDELTSSLAWHTARPFCARVFCGNFMQFVPPYKYDYIISNPPFYYAQGAVSGKNLRKSMARHASYLPFPDLLQQAKRMLKPNGIFCFCYESRSLAYVLFHLVNMGFRADIIRFVYPLQDRESSLVLVRARISHEVSTRILPALFTHQTPHQSDNTKELQAIYAWAQTQSVKVSEDEALKMLEVAKEEKDFVIIPCL